jgi:hypothetical protein
VDILILKKWANPVFTMSINPTIAYGIGFVQNNGKTPILFQEAFSGANVTSRKGVEFYVEGNVNPSLVLSKDISIILQK